MTLELGLANISQMSVDLINAIGRPDFQDRVGLALRRHLRLDAGLIMAYRANEPPQVLFNDWMTYRGIKDIEAYVSGPYLQDPFYRLAVETGAEGLYRLRQIAPDSFQRSQYYHDYYRHSGLTDEFNFLVTLDASTKIAVSMCRNRKSTEFSVDDEAFLRAVAPILYAAVTRHWRDMRPDVLEPPGEFISQSVLRAIGNFGRNILTHRECQVAQLILRGYSLKEAAQTLAISAATVKLHRRNAYLKFGINSQTQLFALFLGNFADWAIADETPGGPSGPRPVAGRSLT